MKIQFNVMDKNLLVFDSHLGGYEIDLSTVYFNENHMFNKTWFTLFDFEEKLEGCMGFIKATIEVLGPNDEPTVLEAITDDPSIEKTVISPKIRPRGHIIISEIFRAEHITSNNITTRKLNPFVRVKYGGIARETKQLKDTSNPDFNQVIFLPAMLPNHSKDVFIELWDDGLFSDSLVGTATIPFNQFKDSNNMKPFWLNIYGPSPTSTNSYSRIMAINGYKIGSTYRGRILVRFSSRDEVNPVGNVVKMDFRIPEIIVPNPMTKTYTMRIDLFEGNELPTKNKGIIHFCIGPHLIKSSQLKITNNRIVWNESLEDRRIALPIDINQIPDLLIYFCDEDVESHRISYIRLKAKNFVVYNNSNYESLMKPKIIKFREEKSHKLLEEDQFPGFAVVRIILFANNLQSRTKIMKFIPQEHQEPYNLYLMLYVGRELASGEDDGFSNPYVEFLCGGQKVQSVVQTRTLNPNFNQIITMQISTVKLENSPPPTLIVLVYHQKKVNNKVQGKSLLGRYWMMLKMDNEKLLINRNKTIGSNQPQKDSIFFESPKWLPLIYDKEERVEGRLLLGYCLSKNPLNLGTEINIPRTKHIFTLCPLGLRDVFSKFKAITDNIDFSIKINNCESIDENNVKTDHTGSSKDLEINDCSAFLNTPMKISTKLPLKKELCPIMEVFLYEKSLNGAIKKFIGIAEYNLFNAVKYLYGEEEDQTYKLKWERNFYLDKLQTKEEGKKLYQKPKIQKFKPENQMIYLDNFVYDIEFPSDKKGEQIHKQRGTSEVVEENIFNNPQVIRSRLVGKPAEKTGQEGPKSSNIATSKDKYNSEKNKDGMFFGNDDQLALIDKFNEDEDKNFETDVRASIANTNRSEDQSATIRVDIDNRESNILEDQIDKLHASRIDENKKPKTNDEQMKKLAINYEELMLLQKEGENFADSKEISKLEIQSGHEIKDLSAELSKEHLEYNELFVEENKDAKAKQRENERKKLLDRFKIKNPFMGIFNKRFMNRLEYQDYDTDDEEDFDDVLPYLKGRLEYQTDLEKHLFIDDISRTVSYIKVYRGNKRDEGGFLRAPHKERFAIANFKFFFYREDRNDLVPTSKIKKFLESITKVRQYNVRIYILRAIQLSSIHKNQSPKTFLKFIYNGVETIDDGSIREGIYPEYYRSKQFENVSLPGTAILRIEIWEQQTIGGNSLLGYTEIDLEERIFSTKWHEQEKKPVEKRNLVNDIYGSRGRLEMWIDIISAKSKEPMTVIFPKIQLPYELRIIVWETKDCVFKDEITKANDIYARGGVMRGDRFFETDTHWRCRNKGSFNWRWKFDVNLPVDENKNYGEDRFMVQLYDRDLIGGDDLIGETEIDLNMHKMLKKVHYRKKPVDMRMREKGSGLETNMLWFEVFHPEVLDVNGNKISQGKVLMSFQVLPKEAADKFKNEFGRANPNFYPTLPDPVGRFSFDLLSPFSTLKAIIGPDLCYKMIYTACLLFWLLGLIYFGYYILITVIGVKIAMVV